MATAFVRNQHMLDFNGSCEQDVRLLSGGCGRGYKQKELTKEMENDCPRRNIEWSIASWVFFIQKETLPCKSTRADQTWKVADKGPWSGI